MVQKIFYNASMPRAGSTLLQNIMMQNPDIYSTPTSGVIEFLLNARTVYSAGDAFKAQDQDVMKAGFKNFCKTGLYGFFDGITDRPYVMEKSRGWLGHFNFIEFFMEEKPKMVVMVRDLRAIFASMEKNFRKHPDKDPMIINGVELKNMTTGWRFSQAPATIFQALPVRSPGRRARPRPLLPPIHRPRSRATRSTRSSARPCGSRPRGGVCWATTRSWRSPGN